MDSDTALEPAVRRHGPRVAAAEHWSALIYEEWRATLDTLHAHTQVLGKLSAALAPPEPQLQHAALRLTARGWETLPLPAPDGSGTLVVVLDLHAHEAGVEHSDGRRHRIGLGPSRSVGEVTREVLAAVRDVAGPVTIDPRPQETPWSTPLDEDEEHATYDPDHVGSYFAAAVRASLALAEVRAPYRGRCTPVNAWWGSFDLAVNLFSGQPADPPSDDFIMRNAMDAQEVAVGWWPGDERYPRAAFYGYAHPAPRGYQDARLEPPQARWEPALGEFILDWEDVRGDEDPHRVAVSFARSVIHHSCSACHWEPALAASVDGVPPPSPDATGGSIGTREHHRHRQHGLGHRRRRQQRGQHRRPARPGLRGQIDQRRARSARRPLRCGRGHPGAAR